jgi:Xaa-Pro aminopeptidase
MAFLTNDPHYIWEMTAFDPLEHSLPPKLAVDGYRSALPLMALRDGETPLIFVKEIDRTNIEHLRHKGVVFVWHSPYFTFGGLREPSDAHDDLVTAVRDQVTGPLNLDSRMTVELFRELHEGAGGSAEVKSPFHPPVAHYVIARGEVDASFGRGRKELTEAASPLIKGLATNRLDQWLTRTPEDRFRLLDRLMKQAGLDALLVASPLAIQDFTGIPMRAIGEGAWAVFPRGSQVVHLLSRRELPWLDLPLARRAGADSVRELADGPRLGIEEVALSFCDWMGFGLERLEDKPATSLLRRWRELRSWEDLSAYIIGSRVTLDAIEDALGFVEHELAAGRRVTELNAYDKYRSRVGSSIRKNSFPIRVRTYFTHTHAGNRSHFPALATNHEISGQSSLKIDGGLEIYDSRGMFLGVSDITRSAVGEPGTRSFYELLDRALLEGAIAACRPGVKGADVFAAGCAFLEPYRQDIIDGGFMPYSNAPMGELFNRNIGHLIGKQEPATVEFKSSDSGSLEAGMIAAAEFQWPFADYCIGVEDLLLVTDNGPINLTRPMPGD